MKVRIKGNSIRIRLEQNEVKRLKADGKIEEQVYLGLTKDEFIRYVIQKTSRLDIRAFFRLNEIKIEAPTALIDQWAESEITSLESIQEIKEESYLKIRIEKDLKPLLDREEQEDWFPNPKRRD